MNDVRPARTFAVSNLAWSGEHDGEALDLVARLGFDGVELAPGKVFDDPARATAAEIAAYRATVEDRGLRIAALQSILFNVPDAFLFGTAAQRQRMADHLVRIADLSAGLGAGACVFGSPTLRDPGDRTPETAFAEAVDFFRPLAAAYAERGVVLAFEANPPLYGCRFVTGTPAAIDLVDAVDAPGFALQVDTGTILINDEDPSVIEGAQGRIGHLHVSEPELRPILNEGNAHASIASVLDRIRYTGWISVEMKTAPDWETALVASAAIVRAAYAGMPR